MSHKSDENSSTLTFTNKDLYAEQTSAEAENIKSLHTNQLEGLANSRIIQQLQVNREKRSSNDGCCKNPANKKESTVQQQPIVVNHYHNYYYNCPCIPLNQMPQPAPQKPSLAPSPSSTCVDCTCDKSGSISCSIPENPTSSHPQFSKNNYQQSPPQSGSNTYQQSYTAAEQHNAQPGQPQKTDLSNKDKNTAFSFSLLFDDPVAKDFYDFVTTNFVKRSTPIEIAEIKCQSDPLSILEDPICKEFFNLFTQSFVRKSENTTSNPDLPKSSLAPTTVQPKPTS